MKVTKRRLKRIIKEEKRRILEQNFKPAPQFPKMAYPEDLVSPSDLYVNLTDEQTSALDNLEAAVAACSKAGCTRADVMDTVSGFNLK
jgi:hypothetical protein